MYEKILLTRAYILTQRAEAVLMIFTQHSSIQYPNLSITNFSPKRAIAIFYVVNVVRTHATMISASYRTIKCIRSGYKIHFEFTWSSNVGKKGGFCKKI